MQKRSRGQRKGKAMTHRVTVRNLRPTLIEGHRYLIADGTEQPNPGDYLIEVELLPESNVKVGDLYLTIRDLTTVKVLGAYQVAF
jgi:hypothetical protein